MDIVAILAAIAAAVAVSGSLAYLLSSWREHKMQSAAQHEKALIAELGRLRDELRHAIVQAFEHSPQQPRVEVGALVDAASDRSAQLLAEAIDLQSQHKEREAIERLLTAYDMEMPPLAKAQLHILAGNGFIRLSELEEAEGHYRQALEAAREEAGHQQGQAAALGNLGIVYGQRGDLDRAEEHFKRALTIEEEIGDRLGQARQLGNLGIVYSDRGDLDRAEEHHRKALAIDEGIGYRLGQANQLGNLGSVYKNRGDLDQAEEHLKGALAIHEEIGDRLGQAASLGNLGLVYKNRGDLDRAEEHHRKALAIDEEIGNRLGQAEDLANLGLVAEQRGHTAQARDLLRQAAELYTGIGAGGEGPETVAKALQRLEAPPPQE